NGGSITGNSRNGIGNTGTATLINAAITDNAEQGDYGAGGGIQNSGTMNLIDCLIARNTATFVGGGIFNQIIGTMTVVNTTISGNLAAQSGGGVSNQAAALIVLINSTVTNNRSDSDNSGGERGGGIDCSIPFPIIALKSTIVAGNFRGTGASMTPDDLNDNGGVDSSSSFN